MEWPAETFFNAILLIYYQIIVLSSIYTFLFGNELEKTVLPFSPRIQRFHPVHIDILLSSFAKHIVNTIRCTK